MATIGRTNGATFLNTPRLQYISTAAFYDYFYTYQTSLTASLDTIGTLSPVTSDPAQCPAGRVLRENGRKLYPSANPGITTYMVGVYDAQTLLSGFIDPNAPMFQIYNTDKPNYLVDGVEPTLGTTDRGPSLFTRGDVLGGGNLDISGSAYVYGSTRIDGGLTVYNGANINGGQLVSGGQRVFNRLSLATSALYTQNGATAIDLDCSLANVFVITINSSTGFTLTASGFLEGQMVYVLYNNTGAFTPSITMGTGIRGYYNAGSEQALVISANLGATQQFMAMTAGVSTNLCELSRLIIASS